MNTSSYIAITILTLAAIYSWGYSDYNIVNAKSTPVLTITCDSTLVEVSSLKYIKINATLTNKEDKVVNLVLPGDGSQSGSRTPIIKWSVVKLAEDMQASSSADFHLRTGPRCGNMNALEENELVQLLPEQSRSLGSWIGVPQLPEEVGKYSVRLSYKNDPKIKWEGMGFHGMRIHNKRLLRKVKKTDLIKVESNELIIEVIE